MWRTTSLANRRFAVLLDVYKRQDLTQIEDDVYGDLDEEHPEDELFEVNCPNCDNIVIIDDEMLDSEKIICPNCKEEIEFEFDCECDDSEVDDN